MNGGLKLPPSCLSCSSFLKDKESGSIEYKRKENGREIHTLGFCLKCLNNPKRINISEIVRDLSNSRYWNKKDIKLVRKALEEFKKGNMQKSTGPNGTIEYSPK
jgi:Zn-finger protein